MKQAFIFTKEKTYNKFMKKFEEAGLLWWGTSDKPTHGNNFNVLQDGEPVVIAVYDGKLSHSDIEYLMGNMVDNGYTLVYDQRRYNGKKFKRYYYRNGLIEHEQIMTLNNGKYTSSKTNDFDYLISEGYNLVYDGKWGK